ncbi:MAG: protein kinase [Polyangiaceae bacterium]
MTTASLPLIPNGATFHGRYQIIRRLGKGGMGEVYEARDLTTRKPRALKVMRLDLLTDPGLRGRFEQEARITGDIDSEHIVEITDAGTDAETGYPFIAMELLKGDDLGTLVRKGGGLPPGEVVALLAQAAEALDKTHEAGIVHRDLKPENLFLTRRSDGSPRLKVLDFGIAKMVATSYASAKTTCVIGTPLYMAPEQFRGDGMVDARADVYALGQIAFSLLVGLPYWTPESASPNALMRAVERDHREPATARAMTLRGVPVPPAFDAWFLKATAPLPETRFDTASGLVDELAAVFGLRESQPRRGPLAEGQIFRGRYKVISRIGAGGMGEVYEVLDQATDRRRALKLLQARNLHDDDLRKRFLLEAKITATIESRHLVEIIDASGDADAADPFLVMELLQGETLEATLNRQGALRPGEVVWLLQQAADVLDRTHAANVIHRDLKPDNLFVAHAEDGSRVLKVIDFGLAKVVTDEKTGVTRTLGTPVYMAPEQFGGAGKADRRVDLYSLGHIAFSLLTGADYWSLGERTGTSLFQLIYQISRGVTEPATIRAAASRNVVLPPEFDPWFFQAVAVDPSQRFRSASELVGSLARALGMTGDRASPEAPPRFAAIDAPFASGMGLASTVPAVQRDAGSIGAEGSPAAALSSSQLDTWKRPAPERPSAGFVQPPAAEAADPHDVAPTIPAGSPRREVEHLPPSPPILTPAGSRRRILFTLAGGLAIGLLSLIWWRTSASTSPGPDSAGEVAAAPVGAASQLPAGLPSAQATPAPNPEVSSSSATGSFEAPATSSSTPTPVLSAAPSVIIRPYKLPAQPAANNGPTGTKVR